MADGVGLSVGATNLTAVALGRTAVTRSAVVTIFPNRPPEVGLPSENPRLNPDERGLIITDFIDRVGDPVDIVAPDGTRTAARCCSPTRCARCFTRSPTARGRRTPS